jgi:hypothetical protein
MRLRYGTDYLAIVNEEGEEVFRVNENGTTDPPIEGGGGGGSGFAGARVTSDTSMVDTVPTLLEFDSVSFDTDGFVVGDSFVVPPGMSGKYILSGYVGPFYMGGANNVHCLLVAKLNGTALYEALGRGSDNAPVQARPTVTWPVVELNAGDVITFTVDQDSGANRVPSPSSVFAIEYKGS